MFSYTGGFSVYALSGGAKQVWSADISKQALEIADKNVNINGFDTTKHIILNEDAFETLHKLQPGIFDLIILDPPAFAKKDKDIPNAIKAYREINFAAIKNIKPNGIIFTFSCSQKIDKELFRKTIFTAAAKVGRQVKVLHQLTQPEDHPIDLFQPKSEYLKGLVLYVE
jgi:23S rRNA (cytosine1962-C5)-methyltransferase